MADGWRSQVEALLGQDPSVAGWHEVCRLVQGRNAEEVAALSGAVAGWPAHVRVMPDDWWAEWSAGVERPWHTLSACRILSDGLNDGAGPDLRGDWPTLVACSPDYRQVVVAGVNDGHAAGGETGIWDTTARVWLVVEPEFPGACGAVVPRGGNITAVVVPEIPATVEAWDVASGELRWSQVLRESSRQLQQLGVLEDDEEDLDGDPYDGYADLLYDVGAVHDDIGPVRIVADRHGRYCAIAGGGYGVVAVVSVATGHRVFFERGRATAVALDDAGDRLAVGTADGGVLVRGLPAGQVIAEFVDSGLDRVDALAFDPSGHWLVAAGGVTVEPIAGRSSRVPVLRWLGVDEAAGAAPHQQPPTGVVELAETLPEARGAECIDVVWSTTAGPRIEVLLPWNEGIAVVDGTDGRVLLQVPAEAGGRCSALAPDGRTLLTARYDVRAWLIDAVAASTTPDPTRMAPASADTQPADAGIASLDGITAEDAEATFGRLLAVIEHTSGNEREYARRELVALFSRFPPDDPTVTKARRRLTALLF